MKIHWTDNARTNLREILTHLIAEFGKDNGMDVVTKIYREVETLRKQPRRGKPGHVYGTRELDVERYTIIYDIQDYALQVLFIWDRSNEWKDLRR